MPAECWQSVAGAFLGPVTFLCSEFLFDRMGLPDIANPIFYPETVEGGWEFAASFILSYALPICAIVLGVFGTLRSFKRGNGCGLWVGPVGTGLGVLALLLVYVSQPRICLGP